MLRINVDGGTVVSGKQPHPPFTRKLRSGVNNTLTMKVSDEDSDSDKSTVEDEQF
jgi:hypothetical protein